MKYFGYVIFVIFILVVLFNLYLLPFKIYYYSKGYRRQKGVSRYVGHGSFFYKFFYLLPKIYVYDKLTSNPDEFKEFGFNMICGKQGSGKTITLVYLLHRYKKMYPKVKIGTNMYYKYEDDNISSWKDLIFKSNGVYGQIHVLDEVQNWFSSNQSKDFPPEMLKEITQQRKQRKIILGTSQVFNRVAKPIREQVYLVYEPLTLFGCLTIVRKYEPVLDSKDGSISRSKLRGVFWFVHTKELRDSFDTYRKIEDLGHSGFVDSTKQFGHVSNLGSTNIVNLVSKR